MEAVRKSILEGYGLRPQRGRTLKPRPRLSAYKADTKPARAAEPLLENFFAPLNMLATSVFFSYNGHIA